MAIIKISEGIPETTHSATTSPRIYTGDPDTPAIIASDCWQYTISIALTYAEILKIVFVAGTPPQTKHATLNTER